MLGLAYTFSYKPLYKLEAVKYPHGRKGESITHDNSVRSQKFT